MYSIYYTKSYNKSATKFLQRHPELENQYKKTLQILEVNPFHPSLRLHKLKGKFQHLHSVSINIQFRISRQFIIQDKKIIPVMIGSHDKVY